MTANRQEFLNLSRPPAMEVVFGVSVESDSNFDLKKLTVSDDQFRKRFPIKKEIHELAGTFNPEKEEITHIHNQLGYEYKAKNEEEITQFEHEIFTYNKVGDYPGGDEFLKNLLFAWKFYSNIRDEFKITGIALRYINVITIPNFNYNYQDYFHTYLVTPDKIENVERCKYGYLKEFKAEKCFSVVNFNLDTVKNNAEAKFILDIDIRKKDVPPSLTEENIRSYFEEMRYCKNLIFFETLKKEVLEQYK